MCVHSGASGSAAGGSGGMGELVQDLLLDRPPSPARLAYTSEKHPRSTFNELNLIRKRHELCDVVINVGSRKIFAHRSAADRKMSYTSFFWTFS